MPVLEELSEPLPFSAQKHHTALRPATEVPQCSASLSLPVSSVLYHVLCTWSKHAATSRPLTTSSPCMDPISLEHSTYSLLLILFQSIQTPATICTFSVPTLLLYSTSHGQTTLCPFCVLSIPSECGLFCLVVLGMEPRSLFPLGRCWTIKLCPQLFTGSCWAGALLLSHSPRLEFYIAVTPALQIGTYTQEQSKAFVKKRNKQISAGYIPKKEWSSDTQTKSQRVQRAMLPIVIRDKAHPFTYNLLLLHIMFCLHVRLCEAVRGSGVRHDLPCGCCHVQTGPLQEQCS